MENILRNAVFLLCTFLSCASFAEVEETFTYGTKTSTGPLSFGDWHKEWLLLGGAGAHAQVAGSEYSNYRADIEKKKYCSANKASIKERHDRCLTEVTVKWSTAAGQCPVETEVVADAGFVRVVTTPLKTCVEQLDRQLKSDTMLCSQSTGHATCKAYGGL